MTKSKKWTSVESELQKLNQAEMQRKKTAEMENPVWKEEQVRRVYGKPRKKSTFDKNIHA